ncbi:MAG: hypothetical protein AAGH81_02440 [Bacteroidota bacterium]
MGKKGVKKKEAPVLFPEGKSGGGLPELEIGTTLRIGRPSNRYYQYLHFSLDFLNQRLDDLSKLLDLEGTPVQVIGEIRLTEGNEFAIVQKKDGETFFDNEVRLFADRQKALDSHELIFE